MSRCALRRARQLFHTDMNLCDAYQGKVRHRGGCYYYDIRLKKNGSTIYQPIPAGWTAFVRRRAQHLSTNHSLADGNNLIYKGLHSHWVHQNWQQLRHIPALDHSCPYVSGRRGWRSAYCGAHCRGRGDPIRSHRRRTSRSACRPARSVRHDQQTRDHPSLVGLSRWLHIFRLYNWLTYVPYLVSHSTDYVSVAD